MGSDFYVSTTLVSAMGHRKVGILAARCCVFAVSNAGSEFRVPFESRNQESGSLKKLGGVPLRQNGYN
jgi:hypothetical protein